MLLCYACAVVVFVVIIIVASTQRFAGQLNMQLKNRKISE